MNQDIKLGYLGIGRYLPPNVLTNAHLEKLVDTSDEWIIQRTGIKTRRIIGPDESLTSMAVAAAQQAIDNSGIDPAQISVIRIGVNSHMRFPSLAAIVQNELGLTNTSASDISAGCASFIFAVEEIFLRLKAEYLTMGDVSYGLAIGVDALSIVTDYTDRSACILFGDGAGAVVIGPVESGEILATHTHVQGKYANLLYSEASLEILLEDPETMSFLKPNGHQYPFLRMDGPKVFSVAVKSMAAEIRSVVERYNRSSDEKITLDDIRFVIPHQANLRIVKAVQEMLKLDPKQVYSEGVVKYGNTSAASIPIGYVDVFGDHPGELSVDVSFGAGFAAGAILRRESL